MMAEIRVQEDRAAMLYNANANANATSNVHLGNHIDFHVECDHTRVYFNVHWAEYLEDFSNIDNFR
jgi:hypothetical protein